MPDIDIDFCIERRGEVIDYVTQKYGADRVCQIITFNTYAAKAAFKGVARCLKIPFTESNKLAGLIDPAIDFAMSKSDGKAKTLKQAIEYEGSELRTMMYNQSDKDRKPAKAKPAGLFLLSCPGWKYVLPVLRILTRSAALCARIPGRLRRKKKDARSHERIPLRDRTGRPCRAAYTSDGIRCLRYSAGVIPVHFRNTR